MRHIKSPRRWWHVSSLLIPLLILSACNGSTSTPSPSESSPSPSPTSQAKEAPIEQPGELALQQEIVFGPGSFIFTDTQAGLSDLSGYQATLTLAFDGTRDGQPQKWSKTYVMLATKDPPARQWSIEKTGEAADSESVFMAEMVGLDYERHGEEPCNAIEIPAGDSLTERLELASFLTGVIGAEEAGGETVNDVAADHYTFDQRALGEEGLAQSTGEIWVATEGGYIVKYLLTTKANADYFGQGFEGTLTLDYELTDVNQEVAIQLPEDCPPGLVDAPLLPDASNVVKAPGLLTYDTSTSIAEAVAFYHQQIPGYGWEAVAGPAIAETTAFLSYKQGNQNMTVVLDTKNDKTTVNIVVARSHQ